MPDKRGILRGECDYSADDTSGDIKRHMQHRPAHTYKDMPMCKIFECICMIKSIHNCKYAHTIDLSCVLSVFIHTCMHTCTHAHKLLIAYAHM